MTLNQAQAQELAKFFFDIAKGIILGGIGFGIVGSIEIRLLASLVSFVIAYICIRIGLILLKEIR